MDFRLSKESDLPFIFNSYLKSLKPIKSSVPTHIFYQYEHDRMQWLLDNGVTILMTHPSESDQIIGWVNVIISATKAVISYVYVKHAFRGQGFAKDLINNAVILSGGKPLEYCIWSPAGDKLINTYKLTYNPYVFDITSFLKENRNGN